MGIPKEHQKLLEKARRALRGELKSGFKIAKIDRGRYHYRTVYLERPFGEVGFYRQRGCWEMDYIC